ncbi:MAG TPA: hypothetical protein PK622_05185 [Saprospiraceae bacterium]|nr:hypothetical protein [Saprospiraceae bacterium]
MGWAFPIPVLVEMRYLNKEHRPQSNDPNFWDVWTGKEKREIDWQKISDDWQGIKKSAETKIPTTEVIPETKPDDDLPF